MSAQARMVQRAAREGQGGSELEIAIQVGLQRGYKLSDLMRIHAADGTAERAVGDAIEANIRRSVSRTKRLPCGEPVKINPKTMERDCYLAFNFQTGTKGDSLVQGATTISREQT